MGGKCDDGRQYSLKDGKISISAMVHKMKKLRPAFLLSGIFALLFFTISFLTLKDYGISWDEILHFSRGQAYLYYFLTGKTNYKDLPSTNLQGTFGDPKNTSVLRRSLFQLNDYHNGDYFIYEGGGGHPPINDDLAALSNYIFFQKLGILDDISSYHLFNIAASALLVFIVVFFAIEAFGIFPAIISFLSLCTYPLFWAESHFNIKDFPEAAFFSGFILAFYKSLEKFSIKWLFLSIIFFSLALGVKFNVFFAVPIIFIYLIYRYKSNFIEVLRSVPKNYYILLFLAPIIALGVLTLSWPFLWHDWFNHIAEVFKYYKDVGMATNYQPQNFYIAGFNLFPVLWIIFTTPPVTLILFLLGIIFAFIKRKEHNSVFILWLLWFLIPVLRVTFPGTSIYGGIRQISEFIPAMALLSALGAHQVIQWLRKIKTAPVLIVLSFLYPIFILFEMHPNENVYFNFLIGGLHGAYERNFPSWGNSFGNAYFQGIKWINQNAPQNSKLSLIQGTLLNVPPILVRKDINFRPENWSGIERGGEYLMELTFNDTAREFNYAWEYVNSFLVPVYELKVDGVTILKIWKNDIEHTQKEYRLVEKKYQGSTTIKKNNNLLIADLGKELVISRVNLSYSPFGDCFPVNASFVETSLDGLNWLREKDPVPYSQVELKSNSENGQINFYIAGKKARYIRFWLDNLDSCASMNSSIKITELVR
jgi:hypothetical protein